MIWWYIAIGVFSLILFLLLCPIKLSAKFDNDFEATLKYLFIKFPLYPKREEKEEEQKGQVKTEKKKKKYEISDIYNAIKESSKHILPLLSEFRKFFSHCRINPLIIKIVMTGQEADELAINYGKVCAVYYPLLSALQTVVPMKNVNSDLSVDYVKKENEIFLSGTIKIPLIFAIIYGFGVLKKSYKLYDNINNSLRKETKK